ncbi:MAG: hypothetical protein V7608_479 [Hyphomicrobiales bacterium]
MIIEYSTVGGLRLLEPDDFRKFKVVLRAPLATSRPLIDGVSFIDDSNALVAINVVPRLPGVLDNASWRAGYDKMVAAARNHGWIDETGNAIRAHVEWVD